MPISIVTRTRLIIVLTIVLLFSFTMTSLLSYNVTRETLANRVKNETLPLISDNIYSEIQEDLINPINNSSLMANDSFLISWVKEGEIDSEEVVQYLQRIKEKYGYFSSFFVSEETGNYYYYDGILKTISPQDDHDVWYYDFKARDREYDLDVDNDEATDGTITIFINHRLEGQDGEFLGVTGVGLEMRSVGQTLADYRERFGHLIYMIDSDGLIQVHPDECLVEKTNIHDLAGIGQISSRILADREGTDIYEFSSESGEVVISARYFPDFDWFLIVEQDQTQGLQSARDHLIANILIGVLVTILVLLLVVPIVNQYNRRMEALATQDELTGIANRRKFMEITEHEFSLARRYEQPLALLMIDIDRFKSVNDRFGHPTGDALLKRIATALQDGIREIDALARWGGEEFVVLLHDSDGQQAVEVAERLRQIVADLTVESSSGPVSRTVSIGVASMSASELDLSDLMSRADKALLRAKEAGRNRVWHADVD